MLRQQVVHRSSKFNSLQGTRTLSPLLLCYLHHFFRPKLPCENKRQCPFHSHLRVIAKAHKTIGPYGIRFVGFFIFFE